MPEAAGRVVALWPAIGMADVQFTGGSKRYPVEELQRVDAGGNANPPRTDSVPGGKGTVPVPTTSPPQRDDTSDLATRVAHSFVRNALYWSAPGRKYRLTRSEQDAGCYNCPKCEDSRLRRTVYKRMNGVSDRLLGCPTCLFLIKEGDILGHDHGDRVGAWLNTPHGLAPTGPSEDAVKWTSVEVESKDGGRSYSVVAYGLLSGREVRSVRAFGVRGPDAARKQAEALRRELRVRVG
jgi:hypothetical protein